MTVTSVAEMAKQPYGGVLPLTSFEKTLYDDGIELHPEENVPAQVIGSTIDYMTRYVITGDVMEAFTVPITGVECAKSIMEVDDMITSALLTSIDTELTDVCIKAATILSSYDIFARNILAAKFSGVNPNFINPDASTIENIRTMINRCVTFFKTQRPVIKTGFTFEEGGYSGKIDQGDGDILTSDTIWDLKVLKKNPKGRDTLQLLLYYIMAKHSSLPEYDNLTGIGFFNPRRNVSYYINEKDLNYSIIRKIEEKFFQYDQFING